MAVTVKDSILINAPLSKVWEVLTKAAYYKQWDGLPDNFTASTLVEGTVIEWEGYSKMTVVEFIPEEQFSLSLFLPKVDLPASAYDVTYSFTLEPKESGTLLSIQIGDFAPIPNANDYYEASVEFAETAKEKIKELAES